MKTMSKRNGHFATATSRNGKSYTVGYGKPPQRTRFRPGQSGNPAGRPGGVRNLRTDVTRTLRAPIKIREGGRSRTISTQAGVLMLLREKALNGDPRALDRFLELAIRFNNEAGLEVAQQDLSAGDRAILDAYAAEIASSTISSTPATAAVPERQRLVKFRIRTR
jgi:hypothetical protein